jgi:hypothetical protein
MPDGGLWATPPVDEAGRHLVLMSGPRQVRQIPRRDPAAEGQQDRVAPAAEVLTDRLDRT